jgi:hypothetical protein
MRKPTQSYLQYVELRRAWEMFESISRRAGPKAQARFRRWLATQPRGDRK